MDKHMYDDSGFTLIEVVFTISIILILSTITLHFVINSKPVISLQQQCQQVISLLEEGKSRAMINHEQINIVI
ncbi:prepilin-type N-terminal cleavage/methylation domain-containing protein, partial [Thomasclavelia ramosa]